MDREDGRQATQIWKNPLLSKESSSPPADETQRVGGMLDSIDEDEISRAFDNVFRSRPNALPEDVDLNELKTQDDLESTRVMRSSELPQPDVAVPLESAPATTEWYVAMNEKQVGPLTAERLKIHWERGEIGPDSLCWKSGMKDWVPLSEVNELVERFAPKLIKPVIVNSAAASVPSAFSTSSQPSTFAKSSGPDSTLGDWKPSAASILASLVQDEVNSVSKKPSPNEGASASSVLSVAELPVVNPSLEPRPPTPLVTGYPSVSGYSPYGVAPQASGGKGLVIGLSVLLGVVVLALVGLVVVLVQDKRQADSRVAIASQPKELPGEPTGQGRAAPSASAVKKLEAEGPPPVPVPVEPVAAKPLVENPEPAPSTVEKVEKEKANKTFRKLQGASPKESVATAETPVRRNERPVDPLEGTQDDFEKEFGGGRRSKEVGLGVPTDKKPQPQGERTVWVPPAPGGGGTEKETLGKSDILELVSANTASIKRCVDEQRKRSPGSKGTLTMRWVVLPNGRTANVTVMSEDLKGEYIATCIGGLVKSWSFPKHKVQGDPITFPFKF